MRLKSEHYSGARARVSTRVGSEGLGQRRRCTNLGKSEKPPLILEGAVSNQPSASPTNDALTNRPLQDHDSTIIRRASRGSMTILREPGSATDSRAPKAAVGPRRPRQNMNSVIRRVVVSPVAQTSLSDNGGRITIHPVSTDTTRLRGIEDEHEQIHPADRLPVERTDPRRLHGPCPRRRRLYQGQERYLDQFPLVPGILRRIRYGCRARSALAGPSA